jgi:hypothetical protein
MAKFSVFEMNNGRPVLESAQFDCAFKAAAWGRKAYKAPFLAFHATCQGESVTRSEMRKAAMYDLPAVEMEYTGCFKADRVLPNGNTDFLVGCLI